MDNAAQNIQFETRNFNRALSFWKALGFRLEQTRGPDGRRISQLYSDDVEVLATNPANSGAPHYHLKVKSAEKMLKDLSAQRRDVKVTRHLSEPGWQKGWVRLEDPDGNVFAIEAA